MSQGQDSAGEMRGITDMEGKPTQLAKTTRPSLSGILPRKRLFSRLDRGRKSSVVWVTGPPGSGKTTLVGSYLDSRKPRHIWYQLDSGDADIATFFYYMGRAAAEHQKRAHERLPLLTPEYRGDIATFTRRYFRNLYLRLRPPFVLVLDHYHAVPSQSDLHDVMAVALDEVPPKGCVILISRRDPPPSMARLRASPALEMIGWNELQLTLEEVKGILRLRNLRLPQERLAQLYERTQGWAAGLILMMEQARKDDLILEPPEKFDPQLIFDYLAGEIFQNLDKKIQDFVLKTAFLPQMTAEMAVDLTGQRKAEALLADGYRDNYFINLKQARPDPVYEYHPLIREFLITQAQITLTEAQRTEVQRKAAALLEAAGQVEDAVALLSDVGDWEDFVQVILKHAASMLDQGRGETLAQWVEDLPRDVLHQHPWLLYWLAASRLPFAPRESRLLFEQAFELFKRQQETDSKGLLLACSGAMDAILHEWDDLSLLDRWIAALEELLKTYPTFPSVTVEARVTCSMFMSLMLRQPHHPDIEYWVERAFTVSQSTSDSSLRISVELFGAISFMWAGAFTKAQGVIDSMRKMAESPDVSPLALTTLAIAESMYYMLTAMHGSCLDAVNRGLDVAQATGVHIWNYQLLANGVAGSLGAGDLDTAEKLLKQMEERPEYTRRLDLWFYHYLSAWEAILRQDTLRAYQQQKTALKLAVEVGCPYFEVLSRLASAQVSFEVGDERKGAAHLRQVHSTARNIKNQLLEFVSLVAYAQMALEHGRERSGLNSLRYALALGREYDYTHFLWWRPSVMARLCVYALEAGIEVEYVKNLIRKRSLVPETPPVDVKDWPWSFKIFTLGQFRLLHEDKPLTFSGRAQRRPMELLKALIAFGGREVSEERLTEALWPRIDGDSAHRSFTTTLHRLRKLLGEDKAIMLREGRLTVDARYCWVDTWALEQVLTKIDSLLRGPSADITQEAVTELADKALTLYQGPFMDSEVDQSWYLSLRERLRNKFLRAVAELARYWEEAGHWEKAVAYYQKGLEADNVAEGLYRHLMICYQQLGRQAEAIETYNRCRKTLSAVLKVEPAPETKAIYEKLLEQA